MGMRTRNENEERERARAGCLGAGLVLAGGGRAGLFRSGPAHAAVCGEEMFHPPCPEPIPIRSPDAS